MPQYGTKCSRISNHIGLSKYTADSQFSRVRFNIQLNTL